MNSLNSLCPSCFKDKGQEYSSVCLYCGYDEREPRAPLALPLRTVLNEQYVVGKILGKPGSFGITYIGWDWRLQKVVAIKEYLPREWAGRDTDEKTVVPYSGEETEHFRYWLNEFLKEARTMAKFDHDNVVRVFNFFEENGTGYLVMDYYEGISLEEYINHKAGCLPEQEALEIIEPVLCGLKEVHDKGVLHRDIKPRNIYLTARGRIILLDFGAARYATGDQDKGLTVILTPGFAPFEQYQRKGKQGPWTDIYACGALLYRMVTGQKPPDAIERERSDTLIPPDKLMPSISPQFSDLIIKCLAKESWERPQGVLELQQAIAPLIHRHKSQLSLKETVLTIMMEKYQSSAATNQTAGSKETILLAGTDAENLMDMAGSMLEPHQLLTFSVKEEVCKNIIKVHDRILVTGWRGTGKTITTLKAAAAINRVYYFHHHGKNTGAYFMEMHPEITLLESFSDFLEKRGEQSICVVDDIAELAIDARQEIIKVLAERPKSFKMILISTVVTDAKEFLKHIDAIVKMKADTAELFYTGLYNLNAL